MSNKPEWAITVKRTFTVTGTYTNRSYADGLSIEEAIEYEKNMTKEDKLLAFAENVAYYPEDAIEITDEITTRT